jgi:hypothetical protein
MPAPALSRRELLAAAAGAAAASALPLRLPAPALAATGDERWWAGIDAIMAALADRWDADRGAYGPAAGTYSTAVNASLLYVHAIAAAAGRTGPARADERALALVDALTRSPAPFASSLDDTHPADKMRHAPGWTKDITNPRASMDKSVDPQAARALAAAAITAGEALGIGARRREAIAQQVDGAARTAFFRYPNVRLNQINWNCEMYLEAARLTGDGELLREDYRRHALRFLRHVRVPDAGKRVGNLGPGYRFHYLPHELGRHAYNLDSAEYGSETVSFLGVYAAARAAGMARWPDWAMRRARAWALRVLAGFWTHAGTLSWDTGLSTARWQIGKVWALAQRGLLAIASSPDFHSDRRMGRWAASMLLGGLEHYVRLAAGEPSGLAPATLYGVQASGQGSASRVLFAARIAAHAAEAVSLGVPGRGWETPPSLYSADPDTGRVTYTTRRYATAFLGSHQRALPWGGLDPVRLFAADGTALLAVGGRLPANLGARVLSARDGIIASSDGSRARPGRVDAGSPQRRTVTARSAPFPRESYAGHARSLRVRGSAKGRRATLHADHLLDGDSLLLRWRAASAERHRLAVYLPVRDGARVSAGGRELALGAPVSLRSGRTLRLHVDGHSLDVRIASASTRLVAELRRVPRSGAAPGVGRALVLRSALSARAARVSLRLTPR